MGGGASRYCPHPVRATATVLTLFEPLLLSSPCSSHCCCPHPVLFRELLKFLFLFLL